MIVSEGRIGRVFVLRLGDGDRVPDAIEDFAASREVRSAVVLALGGLQDGKLVVGPEDGAVLPPNPMLAAIAGVHEAAAVGTLFPTAPEGKPALHLHGVLGRGETTRAGCLRPGLDVWKIFEVVVIEILGTDLARSHDPETGFTLLGLAPL
ncbi:MAG: PPC domain-containing DNA-binding protein [Solidesulfovibrio sp. DCME]|uniref:PPC domain-containing DNA-binding protein n=1 Tax=Solidesulfovibrio sp. DCME TaxID=3447380 RepID=UPI003D0AD748